MGPFRIEILFGMTISLFRVHQVKLYFSRMAHAIQNVLLEQEFAHEQYNRHDAVCLCNHHYPLWIVGGQAHNILCYRGLVL